MLDLAIKGGTVATPESVGDADIGVKDGKIVVIVQPGTGMPDAEHTIDASGKIVTPGGIEPHAHILTPVPPTWTGQEGVMTQAPEPATRAAVFGGTTTVIDFAFVRPDREILGAIERRTAQFRGQAYSDYAFHAMIPGPISDETLAQVGGAISGGVPSFKIFMTMGTLSGVDPPTKVDDGNLWALMKETARHGGMMAVHAEDEEIVVYNEQKLQRDGKDQWFNVHLAHNNLSEEVSFNTVIRLARSTGAAVNLLHVTAREGVAAIREARAQGMPVYGEALHHYLCFTSEDYKAQDGGIYHTYPSLKFPEDRDALWDGLIHGPIATVATDEWTTTYAAKTWGRTITSVCGGHAGIETRSIITFSEAYRKGRISIQRFVEVTSTNAAKILGLYPRKGALAVGSDADIVLWDPNVRKTITMADLHHDGDYSIWDGWDVEGWPVTTLLRGKVVVDGGELLGDPSDGEWLPRKIGSDVLAGPAC